MKHMLIFLLVIITSLTYCSSVLAGLLTDGFDGMQINYDKWGEVANHGGINVSQNNALLISGTSTSTQNWYGEGLVRTAQTFPANGIEASVDLTASGYRYWAGIWLVDGTNSVHLYTSNCLQPVGYTYYINGKGTYNTFLSSQPGTHYSMKYNSGTVQFLMDGQYLGSCQITLTSVLVELSAAVAWQGDNVNARFDNLSVSYIPEPSSILALLFGIGGMAGIALRRKSVMTSVSLRQH